MENAAEIARQMNPQGFQLQSIRLDSGDFAALSVKARAILDQASTK